ncbi:MAG: hypothetical protein OHK0039_06510 [Bacteroidia bacterium]
MYNDPNDGTATGNNEGWKPIGNLSVRFYSNYDGGGFAISNLYINRTYSGSGGELGFFGYVQGGAIQNLTITDAALTYEIDYYYGAAAAIGGGSLATINNIHVVGGTMTVIVGSQYEYAGGFLGRGSNMTINSCSASMDIVSNVSTNYPIGVFLGYLSGGTITACYATGNFTASGGSRAGGFAGELSGGAVVSRCYCTGTVTNLSGGNRGGFVGNPY